jgi:phosphoribosyl 1,2-cyclic phosphate phosphodiesterase
MRASAYIEHAGRRFLIDCGTDFRTQAIHNGIEDVDFVLLTHTHADHVNGLDDLRAFNMIHKHPIDIFATPESLADIRTRFAYCFQPPPPGGGIPNLLLHEIDGDFDAFGIHFEVLRVFHGTLPIIGFRIGNFGYITDASTIPPETIARLKGVQVLITSALRHRPHPTHMSLDEAVRVAEQVGASQTYFTHMCHDLDHEATNRILPPGIALSYDGLEINLPLKGADRVGILEEMRDATHLSQNGPIEELASKTLEILCRHFQCDAGSIHILDKRTKMLKLAAQRGIPESLLDKVTTIPIGKGMAGLAAERLEPVQVCNLQTDDSGAAKPAARETKMQGSIAFPVLLNGELVGTAGLAKPIAYEFNADEQKLMMESVEIVAERFKEAGEANPL